MSTVPLRNLLKKSWWLILLIIILSGGIFWWGKSSETSVFHYVLGGQSSLKTVNSKINVLLLGIAGGKHDGPNLTDTIMLVSYDTQTKRVDLISLPRDLWLTKNQAKVNALYQIGINKGEGLDFSRREIGDILGVEIPYALRVDFSGFIKAVDLVGGIDVEVAKSFDDYLYPVEGKQNDTCEYKEVLMEIDEGRSQELGVKSGKLKVLLNPQGQIATAAAEPNKDIVYSDEGVRKFFHCRFEHLSFKRGLIQMDGETALKFVRSRHGTNQEGTDFARSRRQQLVLQAFKSKALSLDTLSNPNKMIDLIKTFDDSVETNIPQSEYLEFAGLIKKMEGVKSYVIDGSGDNPLLVTPPQSEFGGAWVLIPPKEDFTSIHQYVADLLSGAIESSASAKITPEK